MAGDNSVGNGFENKLPHLILLMVLLVGISVILYILSFENISFSGRSIVDLKPSLSSEGLVLYLKFEEPADSKFFFDSSTNKNVGICLDNYFFKTNVTSDVLKGLVDKKDTTSIGNDFYKEFNKRGCPLVGPGRSGTGLLFDGDDFVKLTKSSSLNSSDAFTISLWVKTNSSTFTITQKGNNCQIHPDKWFYFSGNRLWLRTIPGRLNKNNYYLDSELLSAFNIVLNNDRFHQVAVTAKNGEFPRFYVDGKDVSKNINVEEDSKTDYGVPIFNKLFSDTDSFDLIIGGAVTTGHSDQTNVCGGNIVSDGFTPQASFLNGSIDELMIYNRVLSQSEILNLYELKSKEQINCETISKTNAQVIWKETLCGCKDEKSFEFKNDNCIKLKAVSDCESTGGSWNGDKCLCPEGKSLTGSECWLNKKKLCIDTGGRFAPSDDKPNECECGKTSEGAQLKFNSVIGCSIELSLEKPKINISEGVKNLFSKDNEFADTIIVIPESQSFNEKIARRNAQKSVESLTGLLFPKSEIKKISQISSPEKHNLIIVSSQKTRSLVENYLDTEFPEGKGYVALVPNSRPIVVDLK